MTDLTNRDLADIVVSTWTDSEVRLWAVAHLTRMYDDPQYNPSKDYLASHDYRAMKERGLIGE